jgi:nitroreductase
MAKKPEPPRGPRTVDGWYVADGAAFPADPMARLVYYARLAPSTHNTQPWRFIASATEIDVFADLERWLRIADPDKRELHLSVGCAIEALRIAADFGGLGTSVRYFPLPEDASLVARVRVEPDSQKRDDSAADLLRPMVTRHTSHRDFEPNRPLTEADGKRLGGCFASPGVSLHVLQDAAAIAGLARLEARADEALFARPGYREELARCMGQGSFGTSWLLSKLGQFTLSQLPDVPVMQGRLAHNDAARLASAPAVALLSTSGDEPVDRVHAGEAFMRVALAAESRELRVQPFSQMLEVADGRAEVARVFGLGERTPQHLFRLGHAQPESAHAPRRPLDSILISAR